MKDKPMFAMCATRKATSSMSARWRMGEELRRKRKNKKETSKLSNTYTNKVDKKASTPYLLKKKKNNKVVAIKENKQALQHPHQQGGQEGLHTVLVKEEEK